MIRYVILYANSPQELAFQINESLDRGWSLQGGVSVLKETIRTSNAHEEVFFRYYQAMIKEEQTDD